MAQINVITKSYSLSPEMIQWIDDYAEKSQRTKSQVVQLAVKLLMNKISVNQEGVIQ